MKYFNVFMIGVNLPFMLFYLSMGNLRSLMHLGAICLFGLSLFIDYRTKRER